MAKIIYQLSEEDRLTNHIPEGVWQLCHEHDVFIEDFKTKELISVLDLCSPNKPINQAG